MMKKSKNGNLNMKKVWTAFNIFEKLLVSFGFAMQMIYILLVAVFKCISTQLFLKMFNEIYTYISLHSFLLVAVIVVYSFAQKARCKEAGVAEPDPSDLLDMSVFDFILPMIILAVVVITMIVAFYNGEPTDHDAMFDGVYKSTIFIGMNQVVSVIGYCFFKGMAK